MPRKNPGGRKFRRSKKFGGFREKDLKEKEHGQKYGFLTSALGNMRFECLCDDGVVRLAHVPGSFRGRYYFRKEDHVLVSIRSFEQNKCDILHRYQEEHVRLLTSKGALDAIHAKDQPNLMDEMELESEQAMEVEIEAPMAQLLEEEDSEEEDDEVGIVEVDYTPSEKNYYESEEFLKL
tara:strand:+ start:2440 stop:2976 length:537 start_codon:yes stop_codon:yes gene_type:complete